MKKIFVMFTVSLPFMTEAMNSRKLNSNSRVEASFTTARLHNEIFTESVSRYGDKAFLEPVGPCTEFRSSIYELYFDASDGNYKACCYPYTESLYQSYFYNLYLRHFAPYTVLENSVTIGGTVFPVTDIVNPVACKMNEFLVHSIKVDNTLESILIPASVQYLDRYCFYRCGSLKKVKFEPGSQLQWIGKKAFCTCSSLESITIPKSVRSLDDRCFSKCIKLKNVTFESGFGLDNIGKNAFAGCSSLESITIPKSTQFLDEGCFEGCTKLKNVTVEPDPWLSHIGGNVFKGCLSLESITIPKSVQFLYDGCFSGCTKLKNVTFEPKSPRPGWTRSLRPQYVGKNVFEGCSSLESITIPHKEYLILFGGVTLPRNTKLVIID
jgi:hypothetical protein